MMNPRISTTQYTSSTGLAFNIRVYIAGEQPNRWYYAYIVSADPGVPYEHQIWHHWYKPEHALENAKRYIEREFGDDAVG